MPPSMQSQPKSIAFESERLRLVVFGEPGVGKTTLAMTFPKPLVIDTDGGLISVTVERGGEELGERFVPQGHEDLEGLYFWIKAHSEGYETIVIDSLDELIFTLMDELVAKGAAYDLASGKKPHPVAEFIPEQAEYLANQQQMHKFLHAMRQLGKHIVVTSGVRDKAGEKRRADVAPGLGTIVERWGSVIGELIVLDEADPKYGVAAGGRVMLVAPSGTRATKTRFKALLPLIVEPTFDSIWSRIEASTPTNKEMESSHR